MKHEDAGGDRDPAPSHVPPTPRQGRQSGSCFEIHFGLEQGRTRRAPSRGFFESKFICSWSWGWAEEELPGLRLPGLAECRYCKFPPKNPSLIWLGRKCCLKHPSEPLKGSAHNTASVLIQAFFPPLQNTTHPLSICF